MRAWRLIASVSVIALSLSTSAAFAQDAGPTPDQPVRLKADQVIQDRERNIVTAKGNVEIQQAGRVLLADRVSYDLDTDVITAVGDVQIIEATGEITFADRFEITGDLREGIASDIRVLLADKSRLAATKGTRAEGNFSELENAVYTACQPCEEKPEAAPVWQIKAQKVTHDQAEKTIEYRNAWLEMFGVPILYTPYFSHPDPTVKRKSGFLTPSFGFDESIGYNARSPYYWVLSDSEDLLLTPVYTTQGGGQLIADHRKKFTFGEMETQASITRDEDGDLLGHIDAWGRFDIDQTWRAGYDVEHAGSDTYLRRYGLNYRDRWLVSRGFAEGLWERDYALAETFAFQGLREEDDPGETPLILPSLSYNHVGESGLWGSWWTAEANLLSLTRDEGTGYQRLIGKAAWNLPFSSPLGDVYRFSASLRADGYYISDPPNSFADEDETSKARLIPQVALEWRYPFERVGASTTQVIEPLATIAASPYGGNPDNLPNEDSLDLEFDDTNLFALNRFSGYDRVENGLRANYGLRYGIYWHNGGHASAVFGQSYRYKSEDSFSINSGLSDNLSDYVARLDVAPIPEFNLYWQARFDKDDLDARRHDIAASAGTKALNASVSYSFVESFSQATEADAFERLDREQISGRISTAFSQYWSAAAFSTYDIEEDSPRLTGLSLTYDDDCFTFESTLSRTNTSDRDFDGGTTVFFRLVFKTLGEVPLEF